MNSTENEKVRDFGLVFYLWFLITIAAYAFGFYAIYQILGVKPELTDWVFNKIGETYTFLHDYIWIGVGIAAGLFVFGLIIAYLEIWLMSRIAAELITTTIFGGTILLILGGVYALLKIETWIGVLILVFGIMVGFIVLLLSRRIVLGAKIFEMSCEAVNEHKGTLIPVLVSAFFSAITAITGAAAAIFTGANLDKLPTQSQWLQYLVFFAVIFVYMGMYWTMIYFADAINICVFKRWNNYEKSSIWVAAKDVWKVKGSIVMFGLLMAFFNWLVFIVEYFASKKLKETSKFYKAWKWTKLVLTVVFFFIVLPFKLLLRIIKFLNYYTLTIIVVEKKGFIYSVARSSSLAVDSAADIIIGKIGVNIAKGLFTFMTFAFFGVGGFFLGYFVLADYFGITGQLYTGVFALIVAVVFFFFGYWPTVALLRPISTAYRTILFFYLVDPLRGHPERQASSRIAASKDIAKSISRVQEDVLKEYDKSERTKYGEKKQPEPEPSTS